MGFLDVGPSVNYRNDIEFTELSLSESTYLDLRTFLGAPITYTEFSLDKHFRKLFGE